MTQSKRNAEGRELYEFNLNEKQMARVAAYATKLRSKNSREISAACRERLNPEFVKNAENVRAMNKALGHDRDAKKENMANLHQLDDLNAALHLPISYRNETPRAPEQPLTIFQLLNKWRDSFRERWWFKLLPPY
jgi:hypothetical protein